MSATLLILALTFMMLSFIYSRIYFVSYGYGRQLWFEAETALPFLILAFFGFICSVITFAMSFSGENRKTGFSSYVMFIASIAILFFPIFFAW